MPRGTGRKRSRKPPPLPQRAAVVQRIFSEFEQGKGQAAIARELNCEGIPAPKGRWSRGPVIDILTSRRCLGEYQPTSVDGATHERTNDGPPIPNYYPGVITADQFLRVQEILKGNASTAGRKSGSAEWRNIFIGLGRCYACGGTVGSHVTNRSPGVPRPAVLR